MEDTGIVQNVEILRMSEEGIEAKTAEPLPAERQVPLQKVIHLILEEVAILIVPGAEGITESPVMKKSI